MHGPSAESTATLSDQLGAAVDDGADSTRVGEDLFAVAAVLRTQPGLRRVLTDVSLEADAKTGLVRGLLGDQLDDTSMDLVTKGSTLRWAATRDLGDALEQLGVMAVVRSADSDDEGDRLEDELFAFGQLISDNPSLRDALSDPARSVEDKRGLVRGLLDGKASAATVRLAEQSVTGSHRTVAVAMNEYKKVASEVHSRRVATVRVAHELAEGELRRLAGGLEARYGRKVHLNVLVDPRVLGGVRVEIGDDVIDGTMASRLDTARRRLAG